MERARVRKLTVHAGDLEADLLPILRGSVFHVTTPAAYLGIVETGAILSNQDSRFAYTFPQSAKSFGRKRGWVCFFDLRAASDADLLGDWDRGDVGALGKYYFLNPEHCADNPFFLVLDRAHHADLIPWTEGDSREARIPPVEAWYPDRVDLDKITTVFDVRIQRSR